MYRFTGLSIIIATIIALSLIVMGGCSSSQSNPVSPLAGLPDLSPLINNENPEDSNHNLLGTWNATFDSQSMSATVTPDRALSQHWNVTTLLPTPSIAVTGYDPVTEVIDVDVTITNPYDIDVNDVRLIIYTDSTGNRLMNPDNWIGLYDIPGGLPVNPFICFYNVPYRTFEGLSEVTENLSIHIPGGNVAINLAIDASYPGNCEEPNQIYSFTKGKLSSHVGSRTELTVKVRDYLDNTNSVDLYCPAITGETFVSFYNVPYENRLWKVELENVTGASEGEYPGWILAKSEDSGSITLYEPVTINVYPAGDYPYYPQVIGTYSPFNYELGILLVEGDYAYVVDSDWDTNIRMRIVDISDPLSPRPMGYVDQEDIYYPHMFGIRMVISGDCMFLYTNELRKLITIDISDKMNPSVINEYQMDEYAMDMVICENYLYFGYSNGIDVLDISNPTDPQFIMEVMDCVGWDLEIQGDFLYASGNVHLNGYFLVLTIEFPISPIVVGAFDFGALGWSIGNIAVQGEYAYCTGPNGYTLKVMKITNPESPYEIASVVGIDHGPNLEVSGDYLYFACQEDGIRVYDVSDPYDPQFALIEPPAHAQDLEIAGDHMYLTDRYAGLRTYDISSPPALSQTGRLKVSAMSNLCVVDDYAYIAEGEYGCSILDISDKYAPGNVVSYDLPEVFDITVIGNYAYMIGKKFGVSKYFYVMDFTNPFSPVEVGAVDLGDVQCSGMLIDGTYAYVSIFNVGLKVIDFSVPGSPYVVDTIPITSANDVAIDGDYAYVAAYGDGLYVVDISDPSAPVIVTSISTPENQIGGVAIKGDYAYLADDGLSVVNIANPEDPQYITSVGYTQGYNIIIRGDFAYVRDESYFSVAMTVFDISDPENPEEFSYISPGGYNSGFAVVDNYAYMASSDEGFKIIELWQ